MLHKGTQNTCLLKMFIYLSWLPLNWNEMEDRRNRESRALYRASMFYLALYERYMHRPIQRGSMKNNFRIQAFRL